MNVRTNSDFVICRYIVRAVCPTLSRSLDGFAGNRTARNAKIWQTVFMLNDLRWKRIVLRRGFLRLVALLTFTVGVFLVWNRQSQPETTACFIVHLPPVTTPPTSEQIARLPYNDGFLTVRLESDNSLKLNLLKIGSLTEPEQLSAKLREIFEQRREMRVFDEQFSHRDDLTDDERTVKKVIVAAPHSAKYGDVVRIIDAVKSSGTNDIWLQIDGENFWWIFQDDLESS